MFSLVLVVMCLSYGMRGRILGMLWSVYRDYRFVFVLNEFVHVHEKSRCGLALDASRGHVCSSHLDYGIINLFELSTNWAVLTLLLPPGIMLVAMVTQTNVRQLGTRWCLATSSVLTLSKRPNSVTMNYYFYSSHLP